VPDAAIGSPNRDIAKVWEGCMSSTITGTVTSTVTIGAGTYTSPLTIASGATVSVASGNGVYSASLATIVDQGTIDATGTSSDGVLLDGGGYITNSLSGYISGGNDGVALFNDAGTIANSGTIRGVDGKGVYLAAGGTVTNHGLIESGAHGAVSFHDTTGAVINYATIESSSNQGVYFQDGGTLANNAGGYISGGGNGVAVEGGVATINNAGGHISGGGDGVAVEGGVATINNAGGYISGGGDGVAVNGVSTIGTITNSGTIRGVNGIGIYLGGGGTVINHGLIESSAHGAVSLHNAAGAVFNYATIESSGRNGVYFYDGGSLTNNTGGYISGGNDGVYAYHGIGTITNLSTIKGMVSGVRLPSGTVINSGVIEGTNSGVHVAGYGNGTVVNAGVISGGTLGIGFTGSPGYSGTVIDSGTISGATAIVFAGTGSNLLELEAGYSLSGSIVGSGSAANTLELSGTLGAVSVGYNGLSLSHFGFVDFAAPTGGNDETLVISNTASLPGTIEGFTAFHDIIDLTNFIYHSGATVTEGLNDQLTVVSGGDTLSLQLAGSYAIQWHVTSDGDGGTDVQPACFARGTRILTENGERPVEELQIGHKVLTLAGDKRRIKWIGRRGYRGAFLLRNSDMWPIRVKAGALAADAPRRDLYLSAKHALFLEGLLVPVECLVNGSSIVRCQCPDEIEYFHIELSSHDVILAEGAAAETFVDCDDRQIFHNACEFALLYPGEEPARWRFCAPRVEAGHDLDRIRRRLIAMARTNRVAA
jgi:hypothetical protein